MQYLWLLIIPAAFLLFLYLRFFLRRLKALLRLQKSVRGGKIRTGIGFWFPAAWRQSYDLVVERDFEVICVKCVGIFLNTCEVHFEGETAWRVRKQWLRGPYLTSSPLAREQGKARRIGLPLPPQGLGDRRIVSVLLLSPAGKLLQLTGPSGYLRPGDRLGRYVFADGAILRKIAEEL